VPLVLFCEDSELNMLFLWRIDTANIVNKKHGGYTHIEEYIPIATPNSGTLAKLDELKPSETYGDRERHFPPLKFWFGAVG